MRPTHKRCVVAGGNSLRVIGDFGGGYTTYLPTDPAKRRAAIADALIYAEGAVLLDLDQGADLSAIAQALRPAE